MPLASFMNPFDVMELEPGNEWRNGPTFLERAKEQVLFLLSTPALKVVASLLVLAWAECGDKHESLCQLDNIP